MINPLTQLQKALAAVVLLVLLMLAGWGIVAYLKHLGKVEVRQELAVQAAAVDVKRAEVAVPIAAAVAKEVVRVQTVTKTIIQKVPVYVKVTDCPLPGGFRVLHDSAANGEIPDAASGVDAAPVEAQVAASTVVENYGACRENSARLEGLQSWVRAQEGVK